MLYKIYGASDDLVEIEHLDEAGEPIPGAGDEYNCDGANIVIGNPEASEGKNAEGIRIGMRYAKGGCWEARVAPIDEDVPCPYVVTVMVEKYSAVVLVLCPNGPAPISVKKVRSTSR
jgi:hypothetical protein